MTERAKIAYDTFRGGFGGGPLSSWAPPHWDDLETWIRDCMVVAYAQGKLDGAAGEKERRKRFEDWREHDRQETEFGGDETPSDQ